MSVIVIGSLNTDLFFDVDHFVKPGETLMPDSIEILPGGKGLNQAVAASKAGSQTRMAGRIGEDGNQLLNPLEKAGVDCFLIEEDANVPTGKAVIQRDKNQENSILLYPGANQTIDSGFIDRTFFHIKKNDVLLLQNEISSLKELLEKAREKGCSVVFNPAPMTKDIKELDLSHIDLLVVNQSEADELLGLAQDPRISCRKWLENYPNSSIVLTLSKEGAIYMDKKQRYFIPSFPVDTADSTGAGDVFTGYLASGVDLDIPLEEALLRASAAAALSVTKPGASKSAPCLKEVQKLIVENPQIRVEKL